MVAKLQVEDSKRRRIYISHKGFKATRDKFERRAVVMVEHKGTTGGNLGTKEAIINSRLQSLHKNVDHFEIGNISSLTPPPSTFHF